MAANFTISDSDSEPSEEVEERESKERKVSFAKNGIFVTTI